MNSLPSLAPLVPELMLAVGAMALLMVGAYGKDVTRAVNILAILLLLGASLAAATVPGGSTMGGSFVVDGFARFMKVIAFVASAIAIVMSLNYQKVEKQGTFEYAVLILLSTTGMGMLISAADLIALYLGLELMSLALYVVAASNRDSVKSTEAGLKYFVL